MRSYPINIVLFLLLATSVLHGQESSSVIIRDSVVSCGGEHIHCRFCLNQRTGVTLLTTESVSATDELLGPLLDTRQWPTYVDSSRKVSFSYPTEFNPRIQITQEEHVPGIDSAIALTDSTFRSSQLKVLDVSIRFEHLPVQKVAESYGFVNECGLWFVSGRVRDGATIAHGSHWYAFRGENAYGDNIDSNTFGIVYEWLFIAVIQLSADWSAVISLNQPGDYEVVVCSIAESFKTEWGQ